MWGNKWGVDVKKSMKNSKIIYKDLCFFSTLSGHKGQNETIDVAKNGTSIL